jgi:hypothetical protein
VSLLSMTTDVISLDLADHAQRGADKAPRFSLADPVQTANAAQAGIDHLQTFGERG